MARSSTTTSYASRSLCSVRGGLSTACHRHLHRPAAAAAMSEFVLLVKYEGKNLKLTFPKKPKVADVAAEVRKQANIGAEWQVRLAAPDPDFADAGDVVLKDDAELKSKQVLTAIAEVKEVSSWDSVSCPERGKALLRDNGITPTIANALVHTLGYADPDDLQHVTEAHLAKLPLKPLEKTRLLKLIEASKTSGGAGAAAKLAAAKTGTSSPSTGTPGRSSPAQPASPSATTSKTTAAAAAPAKTSRASTTSAPAPVKPGPPSNGSTAAAAAAAAPAAPSTPTVAHASTAPDPDEDEDAMLARILAEGEAEKSPAAADTQTQFSHPHKSELVATLEGHTDSVLSLALTPDNTTLFTGSGDNTIKVWSIKGFYLMQTLTDHSNSVGCLCMTGDGLHLISGAADGVVIVWDVIAGKATQAWKDGDSHAYGILAMTLANTKSLLFTATGDKKIRGFAVSYKKKSLTLAMEMSGHLESVRSMAVSPDDQQLYSASEDATIKVWHADQEVGYKFVQALRGHEAAVYGLAMSKDGSTLISCSGDKTITVWRVTHSAGLKGAGRDLLPDGPAIRQVLTGHKGDINCVALNDSGTKLFSSGDDKTVRVWGLLASSGKGKEGAFAQQQALEGHALIVYPIAVSRDGRIVVSGSADNTARVWSLGP